MICDEAKPLLNLLYDDMLDVKDSARLLDHLKTCNQCSFEWAELEALRSRISTAKNAVTVPADLDKNILQHLNKETGNAFGNNNVFKMRVLLATAAAALLVLGVPTLFAPKTMPPVESQLASAETLVHETKAGKVEQSLIERNLLSQKLGYEFKMLSLNDWRMTSCAVCGTKSKSPIARVEFANKSQSAGSINDSTPPAKLICYQAQQGTIASSRQATDVNGKSVHFGSEGDYRYALWSQNGRDYLFVTTLPQENLVKLVANS